MGLNSTVSAACRSGQNERLLGDTETDAWLVIHTCVSSTSISNRHTCQLSASSPPVLPRLSTLSSLDRRSSSLGPLTSASLFGQPGSPTCLPLSPPPRRSPVLPSLLAGNASHRILPASASCPPQPSRLNLSCSASSSIPRAHVCRCPSSTLSPAPTTTISPFFPSINLCRNLKRCVWVRSVHNRHTLPISWFVDSSVNFHLGERKGGEGGAHGFQPQLLLFALSGQ
ncbi:uncharacterized protein LOC123968116 [Micropterus dolomieu]|uniref:uncharacterized protein LOC123968116 n=1 Tax=Micropterus dolomieu TaxID=147949 RepID=UPI001E8DC06E|nr:uncharacterized protein LOC123968116 [Micropterus dolomieu]